MEAHLDYLRFACWGISAFGKADVRRLARDWKPAKWLQYTGFRSAERGLFYGTGHQEGKRHNVYRQSGAACTELKQLAECHETWYCTRLDVQVTIPMPDTWDSISEYQRMDIPRRVKSIIESETGATIYIGNRRSETFARLYEKVHLDQRFLRLEFELKGQKARVGWDNMQAGGTPTALFAALLDAFDLPAHIETMFRVSSDAQAELLRVQRQENKERILDWLGNMESSIIKYGNDDDIGDNVKAFVESWARRLDIFQP